MIKIRISIELSHEDLGRLDTLAQQFLWKTELTQQQWLRTTDEGQALWKELIDPSSRLTSLTTKELNALIVRRYRESIPNSVGRSALARARSDVVRHLLERSDVREEA